MNGLSAKYTELFSLSVEQPFYANNYCKKYTITPEPDFLLLPSAECVDTMKRLDYICRYTNENAGLLIFSRVRGTNGGGDNLLRFLPAPGDKLCFWVILKNPAAVNFNKLPVSIDTSKIFYFSNQVADAGALRSNLHLTAGAAVDENFDTIVFKKAAYQHHHWATIDAVADTPVVKHTHTGIEIKPVTIVNQASSADLYFDLSLLPQGHCKLFIDHIEEDAFYYVGAEAPQQAFGVIELMLDNSPDANYLIVEADRSLRPDRPFYTLPFLNRSTLWRFTLELKSNSPLFLEFDALPDPPALNNKEDFINQLNIITNDTAIAFTQTPPGPDGKTFQFISNSPVALQEKYLSSSSVTKDTLSLTLKKYVGKPAEAAVKADLQCPSTGGIDATGNPVIYSDILLTI